MRLYEIAMYLILTRSLTQGETHGKLVDLFVS